MIYWYRRRDQEAEKSLNSLVDEFASIFADVFGSFFGRSIQVYDEALYAEIFDLNEAQVSKCTHSFETGDLISVYDNFFFIIFSLSRK